MTHYVIKTINNKFKSSRGVDEIIEDESEEQEDDSFFNSGNLPALTLVLSFALFLALFMHGSVSESLLIFFLLGPWSFALLIALLIALCFVLRYPYTFYEHIKLLKNTSTTTKDPSENEEKENPWKT